MAPSWSGLSTLPPDAGKSDRRAWTQNNDAVQHAGYSVATLPRRKPLSVSDHRAAAEMAGRSALDAVTAGAGTGPFRSGQPVLSPGPPWRTSHRTAALRDRKSTRLNSSHR